jgi:NAD(P)H dehydrogenase (quinone)
MNNVTVFGASGRIGMELLKCLSAAGTPTIAVSRRKQTALLLPHVQWMEADITDPQTLPATLSQSRSVFLLSGHGDQLVMGQTNVIEAARHAPVEHIVKLSSGAVHRDSPFYIPGSPIAAWHGEIEECLKTSGIAGTILQPNGFMQNWLGDLAQTVKTERKIYEASGDGKRAYIDLRDIAEVAFTVLMQPERHAYHSYLLTGDIAVNFEQVATTIGKAIGESVAYVALTPEEAHARMISKGFPPGVAQSLLAYAEAQRAGKTDYVSPAVQEILGKPARTPEDFARDYVDWFR